MTRLKPRIPRRRAPSSSSRGVAALVPRLWAGVRGLLPGRKRPAWGKRAATAAPPQLTEGEATTEVEVVEAAPGSASFRDRGRMRRRLRFLRRARELAFRDVGGLIFDMRRFDRERPDLVEAKLGALAAVDQELRALERVLDDRRPIHELREPGLSSCQRCGALHASEDNFCPRCGLQFGGAQAMGEVGGAIAAPPQAPAPPAASQTTTSLLGPPPPAAPPPPWAPPPASAPGSPPAPWAPSAGPASAAPDPGPASEPGARPVRDLRDAPADGEQQTEIYRPPDAS